MAEPVERFLGDGFGFLHGDVAEVVGGGEALLVTGRARRAGGADEHVDAVGAQFVPKSLAEDEIVGFRGGIIDEHGGTLEARHGRHEQDAAASALTEPFADAVGQHERSAHVDVDLGQPRVDGVIPEGTRERQRSVVDEQSKFDIARRFENAVEFLSIRKVGGEDARFDVVFLLDASCEFLQQHFTPGDEYDVHAACGEFMRESRADAFGCARYKRPGSVAIAERAAHAQAACPRVKGCSPAVHMRAMTRMGNRNHEAFAKSTMPR